MKSLKDRLKTKQFWLGCLAVVFLVVGVPILINESYIPNGWYITKWGAAEVLSYYGTILGTAATIWVLDRTIKFTRNQIRYDRFIQNEETKWKHIEELSVTALNYIQPVKLNEMYVAMIPKLPQQHLSPDFVIFNIQAQIMCNAIHSNLNEKDRQQLQEFLDALEIMRKSTHDIADDFHDVLVKINEINGKYNGTVAQMMLEKYREPTSDLIIRANSLQAKEYNELLKTKRICFERIYEQIESDAMRLL